MQVDPRFRHMGQTARKRRRRGRALRGTAAAAVLAGLGGILWWQQGERIALAWQRLTDDTQMTQVAAEFDIAPVTHGAGFTDIPGDPMFIPRIRQDSASAGRTVLAPEAVIRASARAGGTAELTVQTTDLRDPDRELVIALPTTREEFAMFQAERSRARRDHELRGTPGGGDNAEAQMATAAGGIGQPVISGTIRLREPALRNPLWTDTVVETAAPRALAQIMAANGVPAADAERAAARMQAHFGIPDEIPAGWVLALRSRGPEDARQIIQLSLYGPQGYVGAMAMAASGQLVPAADAFADQSLLADLLARDEGGAFQPQRLLDMVYSAALRSGLGPDEAGTALAMMAKIHDLDGFADPADRLTVIRAQPATRGTAAGGPVLFIGVSGPSGDKPCYVLDPQEGEEGPGCFTRRQISVAGGITLAPPVAGVSAQRFIPMVAENETGAPGSDSLLHGHVVWSAPQGSPVRAAAAGRVSALLIDPAYGPSVELTHADGSLTRYRGLGAIAPGLAQGDEIASGTPLGVTGKPPGQDQPGLIFQLVVGGVPVDPARRIGGAVEVTGSNAVESLINQIIQVESGGNARAQNPRSTATGLGQFIESTWLRMMRSYRPDLTATMSRAELLNLRFDPGMSREMVRHLAQENEAYLRARGHSISAGRLYLAHFLGPAGADQALRADPSASVLAVMGPAVVSANPFLRNSSISDLHVWADRKMAGRAAGRVAGDSVAPGLTDAPISPEVQAFIAAIDQIRRAI
ncbi:MAG: M23 family metallopeptidase [Paracoccus sp. (in: a-proteobacteria)]|nr:M23 family metallopeptidase [Paracoccus sp. (in: a-proteobacteria)]